MEGFCYTCGKDIIVDMCCGGYQCGCMGQPIELPVCSTKCYDEYVAMRVKYKTGPIILNEVLFKPKIKKW